MKQEFIPPFLGILATKTGLRFWIWASEVPFFCTKIPEHGRLSISAICKDIPEGNPEGSDSDPYHPLGSAKGQS